MSDDIIRKVDAYYTSKLQQHGAIPQGVDWNGEDSQNLRFTQMLKSINDTESPFSILDYGCGFGSMYAFMQKRYRDFSFTGYDISEAMITEARRLFTHEKTVWLADEKALAPVDYVFASGIFNVKQEIDAETWYAYILDTLQKMNRLSETGFAFNMLTKYSDPPFMKDYLYYADPLVFFDYCKQHFSRNVALLHDYDLYEFTIIVKKK